MIVHRLEALKKFHGLTIKMMKDVPKLHGLIIQHWYAETKGEVNKIFKKVDYEKWHAKKSPKKLLHEIEK